MNSISNLRYYFDYSSQRRGIKIIENNGVEAYEVNGNKVEISIRDTNRKNYKVVFELDPNGNIISYECDCADAKAGRMCAHEYAALSVLGKVYEEEISTYSTYGLSTLISDYQRQAVSESGETARLEAEWFMDDNLYYRLKIGNERTYVVKNISRFLIKFKYNETKKYGKLFTFTHNINNLDEFSKKLLRLTTDIHNENMQGYSRNFWLSEERCYPTDTHFEALLNLFRDRGITINKQTFSIKDGNPSISMKVTQKENGRLKLSAEKLPTYLGKNEHGIFLSVEDSTIYISDLEYTDKVALLMSFFNRHSDTEIFIGKSEITPFFNSVLKRLENYADIDYEDISEEIIPPEMTAELYVDVDDENEVIANMKFCYGDQSFPAYYNQGNNPFCDVAEEEIARMKVLRYFQRNEKKNPRKYPFRIISEQDILSLLSDGLSELSKSMEIFVSDRFKNIKVRPFARPNVGVRASENLLELDFEASGYTREELAELLQAYRKGSKFHRFKDGSFAMIDDGLAQLDEVTRELNINDKAFLKENISVPMYRMLYLDSLQADSDTIRVKRSSEFKSLIKSFRNSLSDESICSVPESLKHIMRDYQKTGLQWLSTLGTYRMGGILADDMGLGKTLQTLSFILSEKKRGREKRQFLVVCPSSLVLNWQDEINRFAPELKALCLNGTAAERNTLFQNAGNYDLLITSYATLLRDIDKYEKMSFYAQFLDEAQNIKNHSTQSAKAVKAINSGLRFALTGTPIENTLAELWSIFDFIMPGYLYNYSYFKKNYETPIVKNGDEVAAKSLQRLTSPFILRRLKKEVLEELPDKTETVLLAEMDNEQKKIYIANAAQVKGELKELDESSDRIKILAMLTRLRQLCCDPSLVYENYNGGSAKLEQCVELVKSCIEAGHKLLLFSQFTSMLDIISERLRSENISFYTLTGKTKAKERLKLVNDFNENDVKVFLISLKAGGTGLNLTGADIVIHYDPWWNLSAENQASDRAYRIGQRNNVQVYKLITKNTIEEKIRNLQQKKADLLDTALGGEGDILKMSADEVMSLLE